MCYKLVIEFSRSETSFNLNAIGKHRVNKSYIWKENFSSFFHKYGDK